jgi:hypothetical protein
MTTTIITKEMDFLDKYDLSGMYFEHIRVHGFIRETINNINYVKYDCECICGKRLYINRTYLIHSTFSGHCGCMTKRNRFREIEKAFTKKNKKK